MLLNTALTDLYVEDGVVRGIYVRDTTGPEAADPQLIRARRAVILPRKAQRSGTFYRLSTPNRGAATPRGCCFVPTCRPAGRDEGK